MRLGIFAKTFSGSAPSTVLAAARDAGFTAVQYNMACPGLPSLHDEIGGGVVAAVGASVAATGVGICALSATYNMAHPNPVVRDRGLAHLEVLAWAASRLTVPVLTLCTGTRDPDDQWRGHPDNETREAWADMRRSMEAAVVVADRHGVDLGIEPELANVLNSAEKADRLIREIASPRLRIVFDPANLFEVTSLAEQHRLVAAAIDLLGDHIAIGHAKDRAADGTFATAGRGVLDYDHHLARLAGSGFDGVVVAHGLGATEAPAVADFLTTAMRRQGIEVQR